MITACVDRETISGLRFEPLHHEDYIFWNAVIKRLGPENIAESPKVLAVYCIHSGSISSNKLKAINWIWVCYRRFGYNALATIGAMLARGIIQILFIIGEAKIQVSDWR